VRSWAERACWAACASCLVAMAALIAGCRHQTSAMAFAAVPRSAGPNIQQIEATLQSPAAAKNAAMANAVAFAWDMFIYTNWPAQTNMRGEPDPSRPFGAAGPVVWQTWKTSQDMYVAPGQTPAPWAQPPFYEPPALQADMIDGKVLTDRNGSPVMYEVRLNADTFGYILSRNLFMRAGQMQLLQGGQPVQFPEPSMEVKAAWRFLGTGDDPTHYLTATVSYQGVVRKVGLSGLHISSKALPQWVWATFEQIEDPQTTGVNLLLPIPAAVQQSNRQMQAMFAGTEWAYYQLDGVQTAFVQDPDASACPGKAKAPCLANTQIETYFQASSSCITCHSLSSIGPGGSRFSFWRYTGGNQKGYMGNPPPLRSDVPLDFVWSMREAQ
jgi:hypothetical protein